MRDGSDEASDELLLREMSDEIRVLAVIIVTCSSDEGFTPFDKPYARIKRLLSFKNAGALGGAKEHLQFSRRKDFALWRLDLMNKMLRLGASTS